MFLRTRRSVPVAIAAPTSPASRPKKAQLIIEAKGSGRPNNTCHFTDGDSNDWLFAAMSHWRLGDQDEARRWYDKAVAWMAEKAPKNEELLRFRAEAEEVLGLKKESAEPAESEVGLDKDDSAEAKDDGESES